MGQIIGELLSPAIGIAISPFPIVGLILILLGNHSKVNSFAYTFGWILGNGAAFTIAMLVLNTATSGADGSGPIKKVISVILGLLLIALSVKTFKNRPRNGEQAKTPKWFDKMTSMSPKSAILFGLLLSAGNPKNLLLTITAGTSIGALGLSTANNIFSLVLFLLLATSTIVLPTVIVSWKGDSLSAMLKDLQVWLVQHNDIIMSVMLLFIGLNIISKALV